jgi:hypothetical protein
MALTIAQARADEMLDRNCTPEPLRTQLRAWIIQDTWPTDRGVWRQTGSRFLSTEYTHIIVLFNRPHGDTSAYHSGPVIVITTTPGDPPEQLPKAIVHTLDAGHREPQTFAVVRLHHKGWSTSVGRVSRGYGELQEYLIVTNETLGETVNIKPSNGGEYDSVKNEPNVPWNRIMGRVQWGTWGVDEW